MPELKLEVVMPFIDATKEIFNTMAHIKTRRKKVYLKSGYGMFGDVIGVIGLSGRPAVRLPSVCRRTSLSERLRAC